MILLDTHTLVWTANEPKRLSKEARRTIERAARTGGICIAAISLWEIALLLTENRLRAHGTVHRTLRDYVTTTGVDVLELTAEIAATAAQLPDPAPRDPADRIIIATALVHAIPLVTKDVRIHESGTCTAVW